MEKIVFAFALLLLSTQSFGQVPGDGDGRGPTQSKYQDPTIKQDQLNESRQQSTEKAADDSKASPDISTYHQKGDEDCVWHMLTYDKEGKNLLTNSWTRIKPKTEEYDSRGRLIWSLVPTAEEGVSEIRSKKGVIGIMHIERLPKE